MVEIGEIFIPTSPLHPPDPLILPLMPSNVYGI
jgi:hypothetical protein